ncbi:hypothetical protein, partial [Salmonella sp. s55004]|uniref:hypothetical protein n=1 Tax=Salmonella sp. s55004 TaxID=3159675 RepID=UPI0039808D39
MASVSRAMFGNGTIKKIAIATATAAGLGIGLAYATRQHQVQAKQRSIQFPASMNFPDLKQHNNVMASHLTPAVYAQLSHKYTPNGCTLDECIQTGVDNPG